MIDNDLGVLTDEELVAWDQFAAAALSGMSSRAAISPNNAANKAAQAADALLLQRRIRDTDGE